MLPCTYPSTMTHNVQNMTPKNINVGIKGFSGSVVDVVFVFSEFVLFNVFCSVLFALEVADSDVVSIFIL